MNLLAARIQESFEQLADQYAERLRAYPDYAALPPQLRREAARRPLQFMVGWLEDGDDAQLLQFIHTVATQRLAQGFDISVMLDAIKVLGELLDPLATEMESAKRVWYMLLKAQEAVTHFVTDLLRQDIAKREQAEKSLLEWQQRYELVTSVTRQVVYEYDVASGAIVWSGNVEHVLGFQLSEMDGGVEQWGELIHPDDRDEAFALLDAAQAACGPYNVIYRFRCRDGSYLWMEDSGLFIPDASGKAVRMIGMMTDISERKRLEQQLRALLERRSFQVQTSTEIAQEIAAAPALDELFRRVVTLIKERFGYYHAQIFRYDPAQDVVVLVNGYGETGAQMLAAGHKLALGQGVVGTAAAMGCSILAPDVTRDPDWHPNPYLPNTQGELAVPIKLRDEVLGILDVQSERADALTQDDQLLLEGLCGQIAIAIEQKRTEEALAYEQYLFQTLLDNVPASLYFKDLQSRFIRVSKATLAGFGVDDPAEVLGKTDFDFFTEEHARPAYEDEQEIIRTGKIIHKEEYETRIGRPHTWTLTTKMPLRDRNGTIIGTFGISVDTTEVKLAEMRLEAERNLMRSIIDATPDWIFVKDQEHRYQLVNASYARALHLQPDDFIGKTDLEVGFPEDLVKGDPEKGLPGFWPTEQQAMEEDHVVASPRIPIPLDGAIRIFDDLRVPLHDAEGRVRGVVGISRDVTEQEQVNIRMRETMQELERLYRTATREGWQTLREMGRLASGYRFDRVNVVPADDLWMPQIQRALEENAPVSEATQGVTVAPVILRGEPIGVLGVQTDPQQPLSPDELTLLQEIIEQGALALENARLFEESQRRVVQERLIAEVSGRFRETLDIEVVLRTAAEQIRRALDLEDLIVRLTMPQTAQPAVKSE
ncbi:MAG TPA: PAS domain-containing protein [Anaerolineae bacterium]|nr:PAS domain-containing protein [Anaerolineae bacterium]HQK13015.1 PAS domain-containing protein [Anaerolineae bacterium]